MGALSKQVEKFLIHQRLEKDGVMSKHLLSKEYLERHQTEWYVKQANGMIKLMESKDVKETEDYLLLALLHEELYRQSKVAQKQNGSNSPLQIADLYLDTFYSITKWRYLTELVERKLVLGGETMLEDKLKLLSSLTDNLDIPVINIYKQRIKSVNESTKENYLRLKDMVFLSFDRLALWDRKLLFFYLINHAIRLWIRGGKEILRELFQLYRQGLADGLLLHHGRLSESTYTNIITTSNSLGEFEFAKYVVDNYNNSLAPEFREDGKIWAMGHRLHKQNKTFKAIDILATHSFSSYHIVIYSKTLLIECYFDASLIDNSYFLFFNDFCEAFKKHLKRNSIMSDNRILAWYNLIKYAQKILLLALNNPPVKTEIELIRSSIDGEVYIQGKQWLDEKIEQIIKGLTV